MPEKREQVLQNARGRPWPRTGRVWQNPEAADLDSAPLACASIWEMHGRQALDSPDERLFKHPVSEGQGYKFLLWQSRSTSLSCLGFEHHEGRLGSCETSRAGTRVPEKMG